MPPFTTLLYLSHTILELCLGAIKLQGRYAHETPGSKSARSEMYVRHHAFSLLALALLGYYIWQRDMIDTPYGRDAAVVLAVFHGGATMSFLYTWSQGAIPISKVVIPHAPFALAFMWHAITRVGP